ITKGTNSVRTVETAEPSTIIPSTDEEWLDALFGAHETPTLPPSNRWRHPPIRPTLTCWEQILSNVEADEKLSRAEAEERKKQAIRRLIESEATATMSGDLANFHVLPHFIRQTTHMLERLARLTSAAVARGARQCSVCDPSDIHETAIKLILEDAKRLVEENVRLRAMLPTVEIPEEEAEAMKSMEKQEQINGPFSNIDFESE
ncbi:hypothetical protein PENTCL1PPCAC_7663, partial [Pristionchus entomophagus]